MRIFQVTDIIFNTPLTFIAESDDQARDILYNNLSLGFGDDLDIMYKLGEWQPKPSTRANKSLIYLAAGDDAGVAALSDQFWKLVRPYEA